MVYKMISEPNLDHERRETSNVRSTPIRASGVGGLPPGSASPFHFFFLTMVWMQIYRAVPAALPYILDPKEGLKKPEASFSTAAPLSFACNVLKA